MSELKRKAAENIKDVLLTGKTKYPVNKLGQAIILKDTGVR